MKISFRQKKLPTSIGVILLLAVLAGGILLINRLRTLNIGAATDISPQQVRITNIGSTSFSVSWITQNKATGLIEYGTTTSLGEMKKDARDQSKSSSEKYQTHYVNVDNLKPETKYFFKIISSGASYNNSQKPFEVTTATTKVPSDNDIAQGKILSSESSPASGAIVYLSISNAVTQSAITDTEGNWMIPLSTARNLNLQEFSNYDRNAQLEEIFVQAESSTANATLTTGNDNPTPDIILGQTYNFLTKMPLLTNTPPPTTKRTFASDLYPESSPSSGFSGENQELKITFPSENEKVNSSLPEFLGTAPKGQKLDVKIESSEVITSQTTADVKGNWKFSTKTALASGKHKITVSYTDKDGFIKKVERNFTVFAVGASDLPSFTATPSGQTATPSPKTSPSLTPTGPRPTGSITLSPTASPAISPSASPSATVSPVASPTKPFRSTLPSTDSGTPKPGATLPTILFLGVGLVTILVGAAFILF